MSTPSAWRVRAMLKWLHLWLGLSAGLVFAVVSLTGTVLAFQSELLLAAHPELARERLPPLALQGHALARVVAGAEDRGIRSIDLPSPRLPAWQAFAGKGERHYFDAASGEPLLVRNTGNDAVMWLRDLHTHLLAGEVGEEVLGASGIVALFLLLSGLYLWWPRLASLARSLRWHAAPPPRRWLSWHRSMGVFLLPLLLVVTFTGVAMVYSQPFRSALRWTFGDGPEVVPPLPIEREATSIDWQAVLLAAADAAPRGSDLRRISLPKDDALVSIRFRAPGEWHPNGRSVVWVDPYRASAVQVHDATAQDAGARISEAMYPLHGGFVGGRAWQWAIAAAGLLPAFLLVTGFLFWRARRHRH
ncbi:PepSY-associated TM helix domain-containing protein [Pseudoxanthomonas sp. SE1]|uniref:PepSY-associated TM helix domain-containing protein n=1 Tax=Pseudoxanthomonas sp. SE1 TaxID=1664560 RepID=UPI00240E115C|nr:PepSY-associated TM helix domain-containing protein [Pseudoxanthomonas sp. SE1]WFC42677.1 PepSY-associated TM helix domain-containing protein [Pseudoxanthomonas sp. SE1]